MGKRPVPRAPLRFGCAHCGRSIEPTDVDPVMLWLTTGFQGKRRHQRQIGIFSHVECLRSALQPDALEELDLDEVTEPGPTPER